MKFSDIIGHKNTIDALRALADSGKIPHALLISGPPGIGKLSLARAFAQYIHCTNRTPDGDSCGQCPACRQHASLNFPDMHYVYPVAGTSGQRQFISSDYDEEWRRFLSDFPFNPYLQWVGMLKGESPAALIKKDESLDIIRIMSLSNFSALHKIMLIWLPEKMNLEAANRLLKLIEEPTEGNIFILVSNAPNEILPTIFSRTQRINMRSLPAEEIAAWLTKEMAIDSEEARILALGASGSIQAALAAAGTGSENTEFFNLFTELMRAGWKRDVAGLRTWSDKIASLKRDKARRFIEYAARLVRESFLMNFNNPALMSITPHERDFCVRFSPFINPRNVEQIASELDDAARLITGNANLRLVAFDLAIRIVILIRK